MEITEVKVFPVREEKLKAFVSVVFDRCFMVNDIKIIQGRQGLFMSMPSRKKKNGDFKDVAHPLNNETRQRIEGHVLAEYERVLEERGLGEQLEASRRATAKPTETGEATESLEGAGGVEEPAPVGSTEETTDDDTPEVKQADAEVAPTDEEAPEEKTLKEVEEMHLRESFWTVP